MKIYTTILTLFLFIILTVPGKSQVTNLMVNSTSSSFTMVSGDAISWSYNVPSGASTLMEIWYDVNGSGTIDPGDVLWQSFTQTDNDNKGQNGPPDMNNTLGAVSVSQPVGLAPGKYIMKFTQNNQSVSIAGTVTALTSPAYTISGIITPPSGKSAANIFVEAKRSEKHQPNFWDAITDANGKYSIEMNSDTAGNPWSIQVVTNPFPSYLISPAEQNITIAGNISNINFSFLAAAAQIAGTVKDENGNLVVNANVGAFANNSNNNLNYNAKTNSSGVYQIGLSQSDLSLSPNGWNLATSLESSAGVTTDKLDGQAFIQTIFPGDSIVRNFVMYNANSIISGKVTLNGIAPGFQMQLVAFNQDTAQSVTYSDAATGNFSFPVTNKVFNYRIFYINMSQQMYMNNVVTHPGDTNVLLTLSTNPLSVKEIPGIMPKQFSLLQNYPNPFNPSTVIEYQIPVSGFVSLTVYNVLGETVTQLVNNVQSAGTYKATFNSANLTSGIYFYKLNINNFSRVKKMMLLK